MKCFKDYSFRIFVIYKCNGLKKIFARYEFPLEVVDGHLVEINMYDDDTSSSDEFLGYAAVDVHSSMQTPHFLSKQVLQFWWKSFYLVNLESFWEYVKFWIYRDKDFIKKYLRIAQRFLVWSIEDFFNRVTMFVFHST